MKYKALRNITKDGELIAIDTEDLTADDLGGQESADRLEKIGAIETMTAAKKAAKDEESEETPAKTPKGGK